MIIILTGLPGVGKGTQAIELTKKYQLGQLSTGEIFRKNIINKTPLGLEAVKFIDQGLLVPDDVTLKIVEEEIKSAKYKNGIIFDGFPRTEVQAEKLDKILEDNDLKIDIIINFELNEEEIVSRLSGRVFCPTCKLNFNENNMKQLICPKCHVDLEKRSDDNKEKIKVRIEEAIKKTLPILKYYDDKVINIDVEGLSVNTLSKKVFEELDKCQ